MLNAATLGALFNNYSIMSLLIICIVAAISILFTWMHCKALFTKNTISSDVYATLQTQFAQLKMDEGVLRGLFTDACKNRNDADNRAAGLQQQLTTTGNNLATMTAEKSSALLRIEATQQQLEASQKAFEAAHQAIVDARESIATLQAGISTKEKMMADQKAFVENIRLEMEQQFRLIANRSLDENGEKISSQQKEKLESTLQPFREQIDAFRKQVDERFILEVADRNTLKGELRRVFELTNSLTDQTNRLTNALSAQTKTQGNFGEAILETILTNAGMMQGMHYEKQFNAINDDGQRIIPDIVLHCPDGFSIVIDSKVSLTHYMRYCNDTLTPEDEKSLRKEIWQSFKNHIDGLSVKKYEHIAHCADFVLMFAPVESAFTVAAQHESDIRNYAFDKKVFFVTPSNLLLVVKMITDLWQKDRVNKEAHKMADRAKILYEKACAFLESFVAIGASLDKAQDQYGKATSQLSGNGGLVRQGEMLQELMGRQQKGKSIPKTLVAKAAHIEGFSPADAEEA